MVKGIYIHIPFCSLKCPYCDFTSVELNSDEIYTRYVKAVKKEIQLYASQLDFCVNTIYFGGGTPSILPPQMIDEILQFINAHIPVERDVEITIEVNPATYRYGEFKAIYRAGVNRVSVGAQSFIRENLSFLGRNHFPEDTVKTVMDAFDAGFRNISLDMIYGLPGQTGDSLEKDLHFFTSLPVTHISAYMLTPYENTALGQMVKRGEVKLPDDDRLYGLFSIIDDFLNDRGFYRYELSNWAKEGYRCRHNLHYWKRNEFLGVGVSAWSFYKNKRAGNTKNLFQYLKSVEENRLPVEFVDEIDREEERKEEIMLGLRLTEGIPLQLIEEKLGFVEGLVEEGLGVIENGRFRLTRKGLMVSNSISASLI
ncbi:MAG: radical SAM family heme chaperone HemW [Aquificae bacterium]|nr:radical SAM family heme chaperone HemW [Aquificota bacterium]